MRVASAVSVAIGLALACAACSGDDDSADPGTTTTVAPTTSESPDNADIAQTTGPPETTGAPDTTVATTTVATTAAPSTTEPPATTAPDTTSAPTSTVIVSDEGVEAAIEADWFEAMRLFRVAQVDPTDLDAVRAAVEFRSGDNRIDLGFFLADMRDQGRRILPEPVVPAELVIESPPVEIEGTDDYSMIVCEIDSWVLVQDEPDGSVSVISDAVVRIRDELRMNEFDGRWTILERNRLEVADGGELCGT